MDSPKTRNQMPATKLYKATRLSQIFNSDADFDALYPPSVRMLSTLHWSPLAIARKAARYLSAAGPCRVLDIGSGTGKFCLAAAHYHPESVFCGVEQRQEHVICANRARALLGISNARFYNCNFTQLDLSAFDHFYFYNAFYENLSGTSKIDDSIAYSPSLFTYYNGYLTSALDKKPEGTRLVTYHSLEEEIPVSFRQVRSEAGNLLKCWVKIY